MKRAITGRKYRYHPVGMDIWDGRTSLKDGDVVKVIRVRGCPPNGTMGHCYVGDAETGKFIGLVLIASLQPVSKNS